MQLLTISLLAFLLSGYALVSRASVRDAQSLARDERPLNWLKSHQDAVSAQEEASFLLNEGKYVALSRSWNLARESFAEALSLSPSPEETSQEIEKFAKQHLSLAEAQRYLESLHELRDSTK